MLLNLKLFDFFSVPKSTELVETGGPRFVTFMIYLTSVKGGGYTLFPQANIFVKPEAGTALYWFNRSAQNSIDSRVWHMSCPVLYGNKWIANKWIKWIANFRNYPCYSNRSHYSMCNDTPK